MTKGLICGGRNYRNAARVAAVLARARDTLGMSTIIQGGADGADLLAANWSWDNGIRVGTFNADWKKHGKAAGPIRNQAMLDEGMPDFVIAFPGDAGTADMVARALAAGVTVYRIVDPS